MPKGPRKHSNTGIYHVIIKGIDNRVIFQDSKDYKKFIDILAFYKSECNFKLYAYCLMSNHIHLMVRTTDIDLSTVFQKINTKYALWFNMKYHRNGYLLGGRFFSEPIEDHLYFINVIRYIHFNPAHAKLEKKPGQKYKWTSYMDYRYNQNELVDIDEVIEEFQGWENFYDFHAKENSFEGVDIDKLRSKIPDDVAKELIQECCGCSTVEDFLNLTEKEYSKYLRILHEKGLSIRQLNRLTGITKGVIERKVK